MMRIVLVSFCVVLFLVGCSDKKRVPGDVLSPDDMEKVMWDMIQADRFSMYFLLKDSVKRDVKPEMFALYDNVFQLHKITREEFAKSYRFYVSRPDIAYVMFDSLVTRQSRIKNAVDTMEHQPPPAVLKKKP